MSQVSHCHIEGSNLKSQQVTYIPREIRSGFLLKIDHILTKILKVNSKVIVTQLAV